MQAWRFTVSGNSDSKNTKLCSTNLTCPTPLTALCNTPQSLPLLIAKNFKDLSFNLCFLLISLMPNSSYALTQDLMQLWDYNGSLLSDLAYGQGTGFAGSPGVDIVEDGQGGSFVVWEDLGGGVSRLQKLNSAGQLAWASNGIAITSATAAPQFSPRAISDGNGGVIVSWVDGRNGNCILSFMSNCDIYAQHFNKQGQALWQTDGVAVVTADGNQGTSGIAMASDGAGGVFLAWEDGRLCCNYYAQYLNANGNRQWQQNGIAISPPPSIVLGPISEPPRLVSDGVGGVFIGWLNNQVDPTSASPSIQMQHLNSTGTALWQTGGITVAYPSRTNFGRMLSDAMGGVIVVFVSLGPPDNFDNILAQRLDANGKLLWSNNAVTVVEQKFSQINPDAISDGAGGVYIVWQDERNGSSGDCFRLVGNCDIYAQALNASGVAVWANNGIPINTLPNNQFSPKIITDNNHGSIMFWQDCRNYPDIYGCGFGLDLFAQRLDSQGNILWYQNGSSVSQADGNQGMPPGIPYRDMFAVMADQAGGGIIAWPDGRNRLCQQLTPECELTIQSISTVNDQQIQFQSIDFPPISNNQYAEQYLISALTSSGLPISFSSLTPSTCQLTGSNIVQNIELGNCIIAADQAGNNQYLAAHQQTQAYTIVQAKQTISLPIIPDQALSLGQITINPTSSSGLPVFVSSATPTICSVNSLTVNLLNTGSCVLIANQLGDMYYLSAGNVSTAFNITRIANPIKQAQQISVIPLYDQVYSPSKFILPLIISVSSGLPVSLTSQTPSVCGAVGNANSKIYAVQLLTAGNCSLSINQAGNNQYAAATPQILSFKISKAAQILSATPVTNQVLSNKPIQVSAQASTGLPVYYATKTANICTNNNGMVTMRNTGICSIKVSQSGDNNYQAANPLLISFAITQASQSISFPSIYSKTLGDGNFIIAAHASSSLPVSFSSASPSICSVKANIVSLLAAGNCSITASQAGNSNYLSATSINQIFVIKRAKQSLPFLAINPQLLSKQSLSIYPNSNTGLPMTFTSNTPSICSTTGNTINLIAKGICSITASQSGDSNYLPASSITQQFVIH